MNIYAGRRFGWDWQQHIDHGYKGGDDMVAPPGEEILAPVAGRVTRTAHSVTITEADGWKTQCLELGSTYSNTSVRVGQRIGRAGQKWPHWHSLNPDGVRVPARFLTATAAPPNRKPLDMFLIRLTHPTDDYTEALLTDGVHCKVLTPGQARHYMYNAPHLDHTANGGKGQFDTVSDAATYATTKALPPFPTTGGSGWVPADADIVDDAEFIQALANIPTAEQIAAETIRQQKLPGN